jgi:hypothetical protein
MVGLVWPCEITAPAASKIKTATKRLPNVDKNFTMFSFLGFRLDTAADAAAVWKEML